MNNLGLLYDNGQGVAQDYVKAREWYEKAADKGDAGAMSNLGALYDNGRGVAQDYAKAREWYEKAADKGDATPCATSAFSTPTVGASRRTTVRRASGTKRRQMRAIRMAAGELRRLGRRGGFWGFLKRRVAARAFAL